MSRPNRKSLTYGGVSGCIALLLTAISAIDYFYFSIALPGARYLLWPGGLLACIVIGDVRSVEEFDSFALPLGFLFNGLIGVAIGVVIALVSSSSKQFGLRAIFIVVTVVALTLVAAPAVLRWLL